MFWCLDFEGDGISDIFSRDKGPLIVIEMKEFSRESLD